jgi:hypothetical protein
MCGWRCAGVFSSVPSSFVSDVFDLRSAEVLLDVLGLALLAWFGLLRSSPAVRIQVQGSVSIGRWCGALQARARRQGAFFDDGLDVAVVQLPGVSPLSSHTGRLPLDFFGTGLQIAKEDHVVASCSS